MPSGAGVGVIPARAGGPGREVVAVGCAGIDHRRAFFHGAVVERVDGQAVPVDDVGFSRGVGDVDGDGHAFAQMEQRPGHLAVVCDRFHRDARTDVERGGLDAQYVVGFAGGLLLRRQQAAEGLRGEGHAGGGEGMFCD